MVSLWYTLTIRYIFPTAARCYCCLSFDCSFVLFNQFTVRRIGLWFNPLDPYLQLVWYSTNQHCSILWHSLLYIYRSILFVYLVVLFGSFIDWIYCWFLVITVYWFIVPVIFGCSDHFWVLFYYVHILFYSFVRLLHLFSSVFVFLLIGQLVHQLLQLYWSITGNFISLGSSETSTLSTK